MIISEKQIVRLKNIAIHYYAFLELIGANPEMQKNILQMLCEIEDQQSEELKTIE